MCNVVYHKQNENPECYQKKNLHHSVTSGHNYGNNFHLEKKTAWNFWQWLCFLTILYNKLESYFALSMSIMINKDSYAKDRTLGNHNISLTHEGPGEFQHIKLQEVFSLIWTELCTVL